MFGKNEKKEEKTVIPEDNQRTEISYSCRFARDGNKPVLEKIPIIRVFDPVTREWKKSKGEPELIPVTDLGFCKKLESQVIIKREIPSLETMTGTKTLYYLQKIRYEVLERFNWVFLKRENSKVFVRDFMSGITFECPKKNCQFVDVFKDEGKRITQKEALELAQKGQVDGYFDKILEGPEGQEYGQRVLTKDQKR